MLSGAEICPCEAGAKNIKRGKDEERAIHLLEFKGWIPGFTDFVCKQGVPHLVLTE